MSILRQARLRTSSRALLLGLAALLLAPFAANDAAAQVNGLGGISLNLAIPQGELSDQLDAVGFGGNIWGGVRFGQSPLIVGLDGGYVIYGSDRRNVPFSTTVPGVFVDVVTTSNIASGHLLARLQPATGKLRPYGDALVGFKYFFTETRVESERFDDDAPIASSTNFDDVALSYGLGGGLEVDLFETTDSSGSTSVFALNLGARYLWGGNAEYVAGVRDNGNRLDLDTRRSETDLLYIVLGMTISF